MLFLRSRVRLVLIASNWCWKRNHMRDHKLWLKSKPEHIRGWPNMFLKLKRNVCCFIELLSVCTCSRAGRMSVTARPRHLRSDLHVPPRRCHCLLGGQRDHNLVTCASCLSAWQKLSRQRSVHAAGCHMDPEPSPIASCLSARYVA